VEISTPGDIEAEEAQGNFPNDPVSLVFYVHMMIARVMKRICMSNRPQNPSAHEIIQSICLSLASYSHDKSLAGIRKVHTCPNLPTLSLSL
jgi:hypothetical protein